MAERLKKVVDRVIDIWKNWTAKQRAMIISTIAVVIIAVVIVAFAVNQPNYQVLTTCEDYTAMNEITSLLGKNGYNYQVQDGSMVVKVRKADLTAAKMLIASEDIKSDGYTFEDAMNSSFTTTETDRNRKYERYLEQKFKEDLETMKGIQIATVDVQLAEDSNSFYAQTAETSVSVILDTTKSVNEDLAESIANFLATAVGNSTTNSITIISNDGSTLFSGASNASNGSGMSSAGKQKYKAQIEATVKESLRNSLLATGLYDDAYITLNYNLDWDAVEKIATEYSTQGGEQAIFGTSYDEVSEGGTGSSGTPGTTSNDDDTTYDITDGYGTTSTYEVHNYSYLPNTLVTTTVKEPGEIIYDSSTLAVTFIKKRIYVEEECEELGYLDNITWEEFKSQNAESTKLEVDEEWIELLSVGSGIDAERIKILAYETPWFEDAQTPDMLKNATFWLQIVLAVVILGLLAFVVMRSARPLTVEEKEPELSVEEMLASTRENQAPVEDIDLQEKSETRKAIEKFVDENPEAVALLLRNWLNEGWG